MSANFENSAVATGLEKVSFIPIPKKRNAKECSNYHTIALISHASKVTLKILQARFHSAWTENFQMYKLDSEKAEEPEIKLLTFVGLWRKKENFRKKNKIYFCFIDYAKLLTVWFTKIFWKFLKICLLRNLYVGQEATVRTDMEKQTGSKLWKKYDKTVYCHSAYLTYAEYIMWNARLDEAQAEIKIASRNINKRQKCR